MHRQNKHDNLRASPSYKIKNINFLLLIRYEPQIRLRIYLHKLYHASQIWLTIYDGCTWRPLWFIQTETTFFGYSNWNIKFIYTIFYLFFIDKILKLYAQTQHQCSFPLTNMICSLSHNIINIKHFIITKNHLFMHTNTKEKLTNSKIYILILQH